MSLRSYVRLLLLLLLLLPLPASASSSSRQVVSRYLQIASLRSSVDVCSSSAAAAVQRAFFVELEFRRLRRLCSRRELRSSK